MRYSALLCVLGLGGLTLGCQRPFSITLQPTIEESPALASKIVVGDSATSKQFLQGVYDLEDNSFRWAAPKFSVALGTPPSAIKNGAWLVLDFDLPGVLVDRLKNITVAARIGKLALASETFHSEGRHEYRREVPASAFAQDVTAIEFTTDKFLNPPNDTRSLAFVVNSVALEPK
ncbi:MAG TPA: hypothetical protein VEV17_01475 [Bryobacteraceae bacterium]|nr:hypothetical protein [Bryobacteraceae bacterium]